MTNKPTVEPNEMTDPGGRPSLEKAPTPSPRTQPDATDRQNLADTMTVPLPPENRAGPKRPIEELNTPAPVSMDRTPITDRYEGALDLMGQPETESVLEETPASAESRGDNDAWFLRTGQPAARRDAPSEAGLPPVASGLPMPVVAVGMAAVLVVMFGVGYLFFG